MIVENSGLLTVAALKHLDFQGKKVVSVLSGGNMDVADHGDGSPKRSDAERPDLYDHGDAAG